MSVLMLDLLLFRNSSYVSEVERVQEVAGVVSLSQCEGRLTMSCLGGDEKSENCVSQHIEVGVFSPVRVSGGMLQKSWKFLLALIYFCLYQINDSISPRPG